MKKFVSIRKVQDYAAKQAEKLSEQTLAKTDQASNFLTDVADVFLFITRIFKETFSRGFEFKEFFYQCFKIG